MHLHSAESQAVSQRVFAARHGLGIWLEGVDKAYGARGVLAGLALAVAPGEFVAVVGRSGSGKSTLLRVLAGLEAIDAGCVQISGEDGETVHDATRMMFQDARLLPWKSVFDNVALGLPPARHGDVRDVLAEVGLADRAIDWPSRLSGGQRQRVALARALVHHPRLLLLDEPLGALDALTRIEMHALIERIWRQQGFTAVLVTHDVSEAVALADRVVVVDQGRIRRDLSVDLPRPRARGSARFAHLEDRLLGDLLSPLSADQFLAAEARQAADGPRATQVS